MPMRSKDQRAYLHANKPEIARRFEKHTPKGKKLPKKVEKKGSTGSKLPVIALGLMVKSAKEGKPLELRDVFHPLAKYTGAGISAPLSGLVQGGIGATLGYGAGTLAAPIMHLVQSKKLPDEERDREYRRMKKQLRRMFMLGGAGLFASPALLAMYNNVFRPGPRVADRGLLGRLVAPEEPMMYTPEEVQASGGE